MKKKVAFWVVMILANAIIGVVSVKTYQNMDARITGVETHQKNYDETYLKNYNDKVRELTLAHEKTVTKLLKILGVDGSYDFNNTLVSKDSLNKFFNHQVYAKTSLRLEVPEEMRNMNPNTPKEVKRGGEYPAIVTGRYVLMASHTNDAESFNKEVARFPMPQGFLEMSFDLKVLEHTVTILLLDGKEVALKEIYRNREKDFSLFELPENAKALNFPFEIGKSDQLLVGHFIYINGRPSGIDFEVARPGFITSFSSPDLQNALGVKKDISKFGLSQSIDYGDSSSLVMAFKDGRPELVGILLEFSSKTGNDNSRNIRASALKINVAVDEIKKNLGIDLRELQHKLLVR